MNQNMRKKSNESSKPKERHIVSWSQEEDDILREQIRVHGTDNWTIIASKFKDKTTRQCRRRWFTYLNSDFKRGGWSPEEDMLLCEAQRMYGNRWTEIAKVVSGRTDNAVKNRFNTLCRKRARNEALAKENSNSSSVDVNNRRDVLHGWINDDSISESTECLKKQRRSHLSEPLGSSKNGGKSLVSCDSTNHQLRTPLSVLSQNLPSLGRNLSSHQSARDIPNAYQTGFSNNKNEGTFLKKDDPKMMALMKQEELLNSMALKANSHESTFQKNLESSCQVGCDSLLLCSQTGLSQETGAGSSEYSTGSTSVCDEFDELVSGNIASSTAPVDFFPAYDTVKSNDETISEYPNEEFGSPLQVAPVFRSLAAGIPSPKFSESERQFLIKTLGMESTSSNTNITSSHPPLCKRALLHSL
ncbi:unnamed protein product [Cuscuta epithymum]|uniref:Uncharacterized protein n=1 Tax=Cuscuta epithymum TaxID=186058 RepID=A0AAV0EJB2_9ASTE|nr:unnamed protein product [Cuscuta epithymum]CAH9123902.1 unnamed protein product [Cuscuta epithymum]